MTHNDIHGWFDFNDIYDDEAIRATNDSVLVEVGVWKGKSVIYLATKLLSHCKCPKLYAVDTWAGSEEYEHQVEIERLGGPDALYNEFVNNVKECGVDKVVHPIRKKSVDVAKQFEDKSIDFIFVDASHKYEDVLADLNAWLPKIKDGGVFAGHDITWHEVYKAVEEVFGNKYDRRTNSWWKKV